ncbi:MAG: protein BatD [Gammaproteobacteria bacterium]|nr:MAG: protein BatD [Gammaproteobacteria bacterium]
MVKLMHKSTLAAGLWLFATLLLLCGTLVQAANISVTTDRDPVSLNESFTITFESDGRVDDDPDFSVLEQDFRILSQQQSTNMSIMNGRVSNSHTWQLTVMPQRAGRLTIPAVSFGSDASPPVTIRVESGASGSNPQSASDQGVFLEVEVDETRPYVQAQAIYTVRLFLAINVANASLTEPAVPSGAAVIQKIGDDTRYQTTRNGRRYDVIERSYALFPQTSGMLNVEPVAFQAQPASRNGFFFNPFDAGGRTIYIQSDRITLEVQPIPAGFKGANWLPAADVKLSESWSEDPAQFTVGQPITRTLTLSAAGQTASQLPELPRWDQSALRQYPDQPSLNDQVTAKGVTGQRIEKIAIIPNQPGKYTLPAIEVPWWNLQTEKQEVARLPEHEIEVLPIASNSAAASAAGSDTAIATDPSLSEPAMPPASSSPNPAPNIWQWLTLALFILWLATLLLWYKSARGRAPRSTPAASESLRQVTRELHAACRANDAARARLLLVQWGRCLWPEDPPAGTTAIAARCDAELAAAIRELDVALYAREGRRWDGARLHHELSDQTRPGQPRSARASGLEPLHRI